MTLHDRIVALLADPARTAAAVAALLPDLRTAREAAREAAARARADALDPRLTGRKVADLRSRAEDAAFAADRLDAAETALLAEAEALDRAEREAERIAAYEAADRQAREVADRIAAEYPDLSRRLMGLIADIVAATSAVVVVNRDLPEGRPSLQGPEGRARGFNDCAGTRHRRPVARIVNSAIPPFAASHDFAWPCHGGGRLTAEDVGGFDPHLQWPGAADTARGLAAVAATEAPALPTFADPAEAAGPSLQPAGEGNSRPDCSLAPASA